MRRLPTKTVLLLSILACLTCLTLALWLGLSQRSLWAALPLGLALWFGVDAWRARGWLGEAPHHQPRRLK